MSEEFLKILVIFGIYYAVGRWIWKKRVNPLDRSFDEAKDKRDL